MASLTTRVMAAAEEPHAPAPRGRRSVLTNCYLSSWLIAVLLVVAAGAGLLLEVYRDNEWVSSQMRGQDFISLVFALPLLLASAQLARGGSVRGLVVWLGALGYIVYSYLYIFAIAWNELFLVYLALLVASTYTLIRALIVIDPTVIWVHFSETAPARAVARFFVFFGAGLGTLWGVQAVAAIIGGDVPASVTSSGHPTAVVFILDLGLVVPVFLIGARLLRRGEPWGFVLAGILLIKGVTEGLALLGMALFMYLADHPDFEVALVPMWGAVAAASAYLSLRYFRAIDPDNKLQFVKRD